MIVDTWYCLSMQVGKFDDPATARRGESVFAFIPRNFRGYITDGSRMELHRLRARGIPFISTRNGYPCPLSTSRPDLPLILEATYNTIIGVSVPKAHAQPALHLAHEWLLLRLPTLAYQ